MTERIAIGFGSNLGDREANLAFGREELGRQGVCWTSVSPLYETEPVGPVADQPPFLNQVAIGETSLPPDTLLKMCLAVEQARGRVRTVHWGPRTLDLDILLFGDRNIREAGLTIPHPEMGNRAFVLVPLADVAPEWVVPDTGGKTVRKLRDELAMGREGIRLWPTSDTK